MKKLSRWLFAIALALLLVVAARMALLPDPLPVETAAVDTRDLRVTVEEQGRTRAHLPYTVTAPVSGQLLRSGLIEGDRVEAGDVMARITVPPEDPRGELSARASVAAAEAREEASRASVEEAEAALELARREARRREELFGQGVIGEEERDRFQQNAETARARLNSARARLSAARADVALARAGLLGIDHGAGERRIHEVVAPVGGTVYTVFERGERVVQAGTELYLLSDGDAMELVIDLLTREAVNVSPDDRILISGWGGERTLEGRVKYVEPEAFTKISALGVEEQRVNAIGELVEPDSPLGAGYRIEAAIVVEALEDVLTVPVSALFRRDGGWRVFRVEQETARMRRVEIGQRGNDHARVLDGLQTGDRVIVFPSNRIAEGVSVSPQ